MNAIGSSFRQYMIIPLYSKEFTYIRNSQRIFLKLHYSVYNQYCIFQLKSHFLKSWGRSLTKRNYNYHLLFNSEMAFACQQKIDRTISLKNSCIFLVCDLQKIISIISNYWNCFSIIYNNSNVFNGMPWFFVIHNDFQLTMVRL